MKITNMVLGNLEVNCYIVESSEKNCAIIDPGFFGDQVVGKIKKLGLKPDSIMLTHGHYDHIGGISKIVESYPEIKVYIGKKELPVVRSMEEMANNNSGEIVREKGILVAENDLIKLDELEFKVVNTPGHSQGGVVYICANSMFSGDTLFYHEIGRCDLISGDYAAMLRTLKKLVELGVNYDVYPGHGDPTTMEEEKSNNQYIGLALVK